jgi:hypothetical protein
VDDPQEHQSRVTSPGPVPVREEDTNAQERRDEAGAAQAKPYLKRGLQAPKPALFLCLAEVVTLIWLHRCPGACICHPRLTSESRSPTFVPPPQLPGSTQPPEALAARFLQGAWWVWEMVHPSSACPSNGSLHPALPVTACLPATKECEGFPRWPLGSPSPGKKLAEPRASGLGFPHVASS